jgi:hypothetical protein
MKINEKQVNKIFKLKVFFFRNKILLSFLPQNNKEKGFILELFCPYLLGFVTHYKIDFGLKCLKSDRSNPPLTFIFIAKTFNIKSNQKRFFLQFHFLQQEISVSLIQKENFSD